MVVHKMWQLDDTQPQALTKKTSDDAPPLVFPLEIIEFKQLDHRRQEHFG